MAKLQNNSETWGRALGISNPKEDLEDTKAGYQHFKRAEPMTYDPSPETETVIKT